MLSRCLSIGCLVLCLALPCPAPACSLCGSFAAGRSIVYEYQEASMVAFGVLANPKLGPDGKGTTEFHIEKIMKSDLAAPADKTMILAQYLPVLNPK
ncbi:MAG: hypothetical protein EXS16_02525, partial [Gemmataceae bacterium]|nr:hypothetical protein [Gemmataceae bacterium]